MQIPISDNVMLKSVVLNGQRALDLQDERNPFSILTGSKISSVRLFDEDRLAIRFKPTDYPYSTPTDTNSLEATFYTRGSCCNHVFFNSVDGADSKGVVLHSEAKTWNDVPEDQFVGTQEYEEASFWSIFTDDGIIDVEVRNSNNGYYSGEIYLYSLDEVND